jgi:hypothetical protein
MVQIMATGLFKYFPTDDDKLKWFARKQILLTPPEYLNDPWDFLVRFEPYAEAQLESKAQEMQLPIEHLRQTVTSNDFLTDESRNYQREIGKKIGVVCLAENPLDRLMWAYYAESHHGFVAEFAHGDEYLEYGFRQQGGPFGPAAKVQYLKSHEQQPECKRDSSNIANVLWTKHSKWGYEQEWRVIQSHDKATPGLARDGTPRSLLKFEPNHLIRVIFGLHICPTVEAKLREMLSHPEFRNVRKERAAIDHVTNELIPRELH